jgi:hypothetical protein
MCPTQVSTLEQKTNFVAAYVSAGLSAQLPQLMSQLLIHTFHVVVSTLLLLLLDVSYAGVHP